MTQKQIELFDAALTELGELENVCPSILTTDCYKRAMKLLGEVALSAVLEDEEE